jgi:hypothetical protein
LGDDDDRPVIGCRRRAAIRTLDDDVPEPGVIEHQQQLLLEVEALVQAVLLFLDDGAPVPTADSDVERPALQQRIEVGQAIDQF